MNTSALTGALHEIKQFQLFREMTKDQIELLCSDGTVKVLRHRELLFKAGDEANSFGVVLSGAFKLSRTDLNGEDAIIHFSSPGDILAALVLPQQSPKYPVNVRAMGPSRVLVIPRDVYLKFWLTNPTLMASVQGLLSSRMAKHQHLRVMQRAPLSAKVASLLLQLGSKAGGSNELEVSLPLTRKEIADSIGVTVESVIRIMSEWSKVGYIKNSENSIQIVDPAKLVEEIHQSES